MTDEHGNAVYYLRKLWREVFPTLPVPAKKQFYRWCHIHDGLMPRIETALRRTAEISAARETPMDTTEATRYASGLMLHQKTFDEGRIAA
jgi:hypothetical protein